MSEPVTLELSTSSSNFRIHMMVMLEDVVVTVVVK